MMLGNVIYVTMFHFPELKRYILQTVTMFSILTHHCLYVHLVLDTMWYQKCNSKMYIYKAITVFAKWPGFMCVSLNVL
jgi:hypothetical protein